MENPLKFLSQKYNNLSSTKPVERAVAVSGEPINNKESQIQTYLNRIEKIMQTERFGGKKTGADLLHHMITQEFIIGDDHETLIRLAKALYESEKRIAIERGQTNQIQPLDMSDGELLQKYKQSILEKRNIQKRTLDSWLSYLATTNDYPMWFKYYTVRSLKDMGQFNRHDTETDYIDKQGDYQTKTITGPSYNNRTDDTIAPFPELNSEALGFVRKSIEQQMELDNYVLPADIEQDILTTTTLDEQTIATISEKSKPEFFDLAVKGALKNERNKKRSEYIQSHKNTIIQDFASRYPIDETRSEALLSELTNRLQSSDFAKMYAFGQVETAGNLDRSSLLGQWKKYDQGSDYTVLEHALQGKGTGWCTAEGSAQGQLQNGDFYVYFTQNKDGVATEPRIAIRMSGDSIGEIRGVNPRQEMEPELVDTAKEFYQDLNGAEKYEQADADMKYLTSIYNRCFKTNPETKQKMYIDTKLGTQELQFLYEIHKPIKSFGYDKDPRIVELKSHRDLKTDLPILFNCTPEQVATNVTKISENTIAYIGPWSPTIADQIPETVTHLYEQFPEIKILRTTLELQPKTPQQYETEITHLGYSISSGAKHMLEHMKPLEQSETIDIVSFTLRQLGFTENTPYSKIKERALELGLKLCPPQVGPELRTMYTDQPNGTYKLVAMESLPDQNGSPRIWHVNRRDDGSTWLFGNVGQDDNIWLPDYEFVFSK